ncbi:MAG: hypothetical protein ACW98F_00055 [Candidatus Hodarchaeales archaeon]|jgi:hypothetical protein
MALPWTYNDNKLYGNITTNSRVMPAIAVVLYKVTEAGVITSQSDYDTTDSLGDWSFDISESGWYTVKFYGGGTTETDWILRIYLEFSPVDLALFEDLTYTTSPTITVTESSVRRDVNKGEISIISISFLNLAPDTGTLTNVEIYYKQSSDSTYEWLRTIPMVEQPDTLTVRHEIVLKNKPDYYDFRAIFLNGAGVPYKISEVVYYAEATNVQLDGIPDVFEYIEVTDLEALNTPDPESGPMLSNTMKMEWTDLKNLEESAFPIETNDAFGRAYSLSYVVASKIENYVVYMYLSETNDPPAKQHPGISALWDAIPYDTAPWAYKGQAFGETGVWVFMGSYTAPYCEVEVPDGRFVSFWVGFKTPKTQTGLSAERAVY